MARVELYCGPHRSGRAAAVDAVMRANIAHAVLIVPSSTHARQRMERLLIDGGLAGAWGRPVRPFAEFTTELLRREGVRIRRVDNFDRRLLLDACLDGLGDGDGLGPFATARTRPGVASHLLRVVTQLKQAAVDPPNSRAVWDGAPRTMTKR